jgi:hypothetical protein
VNKIKFKYILLILVIVLIGWAYSNIIRSKELLHNELAAAACKNYGYDTTQYKFVVADSDSGVKEMTITYLKSDKTWKVKCMSNLVNPQDKWYFLDNFNEDSLKFSSAIKAFMDNLRIYGFYPETEKVKLREAMEEYRIKYPKRNEDLKKMDALLR